VHGHLAAVPWSAELDEIKAPILTKCEPEDFLDFSLLYTAYAKKLFDVGERHNTEVFPKPVYDCVEEYNLLYICTVSDILPEEERGEPEQIDPMAIHNAVLGVTANDCGNRVAVVLAKLGQIKIHIDGVNGLASIAEGWKTLLKIGKHYRADIVPKVLCTKLLAGVTPISVRLAISISNLQKGGTPMEQASYQDVSALHSVLVDLARLAKEAHHKGIILFKAEPKRAGLGLTATVQDKALPDRTSGTRSKAGMSDACRREGPCSEHGEHSLHADSECYK
jgi:hypothetical protein